MKIYEHEGWETTNNKMAFGGGQVGLAPAARDFTLRVGPASPHPSPRIASPINILTGIAWTRGDAQYSLRHFIAARISITVRNSPIKLGKRLVLELVAGRNETCF